MLVPRSDCLFITLDMSDVPAGAKSMYLAQQIEKVSPWAAAGSYSCSVNDSRIAIWLWDSEAVDALRDELPLPMRQSPLYPEAALLRPHDHGPVVRACSVGFDYQLWDSGELVKSRWKISQADDAESRMFERTLGHASEHGEVGDTPVWLAKPWTEPPLNWRTLISDEAAVMTAVSLVFVFLFALEVGMAATFSLRTQLAESNVLSLQEELGERLQYRLQAERLRAANEQWASVRTKPSILEVVAEFTKLMAGQEYALLDWEYQQNGLQVLLSNAELDTREAITQLESGQMFSSAKIEPGLRPEEHKVSLVIGDAE